MMVSILIIDIAVGLVLLILALLITYGAAWGIHSYVRRDKELGKDLDARGNPDLQFYVLDESGTTINPPLGFGRLQVNKISSLYIYIKNKGPGWMGGNINSLNPNWQTTNIKNDISLGWTFGLLPLRPNMLRKVRIDMAIKHLLSLPEEHGHFDTVITGYKWNPAISAVIDFFLSLIGNKV
jgi:hypothetical protein